MIKVLIAEDMHLIRGALIALLGMQDDIEIVAELARGDEIVAAALATTPDVAVLDIDLPGQDGVTAAAELAEKLPSCHALILTALGNPANLRRALSASVRGFMVKDAPAEQLAEAIRRVAKGEWTMDQELIAAALRHGENPLTDREAEVLKEAAAGAGAAEIGTRLSLSTGTVRNYLAAAVSKVGARNRVDAIRIAKETGWI
ncbi:response regulator transcription factor [Allokutzneria oryzae]|uniref:DNA-binding response regulator n=1 Tax=Allokutzneria oryzae TaxID=1378989 RepID=A0ABV5ZX94_9PSEU